MSRAAMASRTASRYLSRRLFSGKILSEEEKAAENVYIKKMEQEKLEKLARKGPKPGETPAISSEGLGSEPGAGTSSTDKVSTDEWKNYAFIAGIATVAAGFGWYYGSRPSKPSVVPGEDD